MVLGEAAAMIMLSFTSHILVIIVSYAVVALLGQLLKVLFKTHSFLIKLVCLSASERMAISEDVLCLIMQDLSMNPGSSMFLNASRSIRQIFFFVED